MRPERKRNGMWRRAGALGVSVVVHGAVVVVLAYVDRPEPKVIHDLELVEVTLLDNTGVPSPAVDPPADATTTPPNDPGADDDPGTETPAPVPSRSRRASSEPVDPGADSEADAEPSTLSEPSPSSQGLALTGLRGASRARTGGAAPPRVVLPETTGKPVRPAPKPAGNSTSPPAASESDDAPRSLAEAGFRPRSDGTYRYRSGPVKAVLHPNGRLEFKFAASQAHNIRLQEVVRAAYGREIYVKAKKQLLQRTFELRMNLAVSWAREQMSRQLSALYRQLMATWRKSEWTPARRRRELFTLWDDCEESLTLDLDGVERAMLSKIDKERESAGTKARQKIIEFIGRQLPEGSPDAYTPRELQALNAKRRSAQRFEPYAG